MTRFAIPDFGDPDCIFVCGIFCDDVTKAPRHLIRTLEQELRGPIGGYFVWDARDGKNDGSPLFLVAAGSGILPLMAMIRHRAYWNNKVPTKLLYSSRSYDDVIYREELDHISANDSSLRVIHTLTRYQSTNWMSYGRRIDRAMLADNAWLTAGKTACFHLWSDNAVGGVLNETFHSR